MAYHLVPAFDRLYLFLVWLLFMGLKEPTNFIVQSVVFEIRSKQNGEKNIAEACLLVFFPLSSSVQEGLRSLFFVQFMVRFKHVCLTANSM